METKDFDKSFLKVIFIGIYKYNEIFLEIHNNNEVKVKTCILFRLPINEDFSYSIEVMDFINKLLVENSEYKIKILKDRRLVADSNKDLVMLYSNNLEVNFNDVIIKHIKTLIEQERLRTMISNIRKRKKV